MLHLQWIAAVILLDWNQGWFSQQIAVDRNGSCFRILVSDCNQLRPTCSFVGGKWLPVLWPMCYSGLAVLLCVLSSDGMWAPALTASIWTSGTLLPRCSSPKPKVLLPARTRCSNFFITPHVLLCKLLSSKPVSTLILIHKIGVDQTDLTKVLFQIQLLVKVQT